MTFISSIGTAVPRHRMAQSDAAAMAVSLTGIAGRRERSLAALYRRSGVAQRHSVILTSSTNGVPAEQEFFRPAIATRERGPSTARRMRAYERLSTPLALRAARLALAENSHAPESITHLVTVSCTGFSAPGWDVQLIERLGLPHDVQRTHVGFMGCHGALNGLRVARALCQSDPAATVLLCATELCSLHFQYESDPQSIVSNSLFGDGSAAVVLHSHGLGEGDSWRLVSNGSTLLCESQGAMSWRVGNHGFAMRLAAVVPEIIRQRLAPWVDGWLARHGVRREHVGSWAVHPGGPRILEACSDALSLSAGALDASWDVLSSCGNMSSPTVLFILKELMRRDAPRPTVTLAFGPGLTVEAALLQ
jgi:predicted naringenin-chalcone synthase